MPGRYPRRKHGVEAAVPSGAVTTRPPEAHHLAQLNIGRLLAPLESRSTAGFVEALDPVNALADAHPGFVWRLQTEEGNATAVRPFDDPDVLVNLSVWRSIDDVHDFAYHGGHLDVLRRRRSWFEVAAEPTLVLWWVPAGHEPSVEEAKARLMFLRSHGPSAYAFTFKGPEPPLDVVPSGLSDPDVRALIGELNAELVAETPRSQHFFHVGDDDVAPGRGALFALYLDGAPVACGAVRTLDDDSAELKRMYVRPAFRGRKLGAVLVDVLEAEARSLGVDQLLLETDAELTAAVRLYERAGFRPVERYGEYVDSPSSYCMGKRLR
jgi:GNAT superfamily N-acetyltransferase